MNNFYFPFFLFFSLFPFSKQFSVVPFLTFGLILDRIIYSMPFLNTIFFVICYVFFYFLKPPLKRRSVNIRVILVLFLYFLLFSFYTLNFSWTFYGAHLIGNLLFVNLFYEKGRIYLKKRKKRYVILL